MRQKEVKMKKNKTLTGILAAVYLILLTWIILFKLQFSFSDLPHIRSINLIPFHASVIVNGTIDFDEIINNFLVFLPVGLYTCMLKPHWNLLRKIAPAFFLSLFYEALQYIFAIGATDITDLISNTLGGCAGVLLFVLLEKLLKKNTLRILNIAAVLCTIVVIAFISLILIMSTSA